jgi:hypothetical protein
LLSNDRLSKKPLLFKSFTTVGFFTVQQLGNINYKEITKRYVKHEIQQLSKKYPERETGAVGKPFKLDVKNRRLMLLVYYRLFHITYVYVSCLSLCFRSKEQPLQIYTKD